MVNESGQENAALIAHDDWYAIIDLVTQSVDSPHSKRAYSRALIDFLDWYEQSGRPGFTKATINAYREFMLQAEKSRSSINQALSAIRKLAVEAADNGLVPPTLAYGVERVKGVKQEGVRAGNWLTKDEAEKLVNTPVYRWRQEEIPALKAIRDQAILAVMIGTGLRRSEVAGLTWAVVQQRDGRWAIIDLIGKRGRVRSVGIPPWVKVALDRWAEGSGIYTGRIFRALNKDGRLAGVVRTKGRQRTDGNMTAQAIYNVVKEYVLAAGYINRKGDAALAAHDLRRTAAALALKGGADLRQIQQMLGHASITTTERYLEPMRSLQVTASDFIQIELALATAGGDRISVASDDPKAEQASSQEQFLALLAQFDDEDLLLNGEDHVCQLAAEVGAEAISPLESILADANRPEQARILAILALKRIGRDHRDLRLRCSWILGQVLENFSQNTPQLNGDLIWGLLDLKARPYRRLMEEAFAAKAVDTDIVGRASIKADLDPPKESFVPDFPAGIDPYGSRLPLGVSSLGRRFRLPKPAPEPDGGLPGEPLTLLDPPDYRLPIPQMSDLAPTIQGPDPGTSFAYAPPARALLQLGHQGEIWPDYRCLGLTLAQVPVLLQMITDPRLNDFHAPILHWTPVHALRALGQLGAVTAIEPIVELMLATDIHDRFEEAPTTFALMGPPAIPHLAAALRRMSAAEEDWCPVATLSSALAQLAQMQPETRKEIITILMDNLAGFTSYTSEVRGFLAYDLVALRAVEAAPLLEKVTADVPEYEPQVEIAGDWFAIQYHLDLLSASAAAVARERADMARRQKLYSELFWPGRDFWDFGDTLPESPLDDSNDHNRKNKVHLSHVKMRAGRWAYNLLNGWKYGPFAILAIETTETAGDAADIVQLGLLDEDGQVLLDTTISPDHRLATTTVMSRSDTDEVAVAPTLCELRETLAGLLANRLVVVYERQRLRLLDRLIDKCDSRWSGKGSRDLGAQYAYFYGELDPEGWPLRRQPLANACIQQGVPLPPERTAIGHCRMMYGLLLRMASWVTQYPEHIPQPPYPYSLLARSYENPDWLRAKLAANL